MKHKEKKQIYLPIRHFEGDSSFPFPQIILMTCLTQQIVRWPCTTNTSEPTSQISTVATVTMVTVMVTTAGVLIAHVLIELHHVLVTNITEDWNVGVGETAATK